MFCVVLRAISCSFLLLYRFTTLHVSWSCCRSTDCWIDWRAGSGLAMLTQRHVLILDAGDTSVLECSFKSLRYDMFDYPVIWRKQQLHEWTQINVMGSVNEPFVSSDDRFELSFTATPPYYLIQLSILGRFTFPSTFLFQDLLNGLVVSTLAIRTRGPRFDSRVVPLFHWASCLLTLPPQFLSSKKLGYKKGVFCAWVVMVIKCARLS